MTKTLPPVSPGEMLEMEFLAPLGMTKERLARRLGVPAERIGEIIAGERGITAEEDRRLCRLFGLSEGWWVRLKAGYEVRIGQRELDAAANEIKPLKAK